MIIGAFIAKFWRDGALLLLATLCYFAFHSSCSSAKLASKYEADLKASEASLKVCQEDMEARDKDLDKVAQARDEFERKFKEELAKPPKVVTKVKTIVERIPGEIVSTDCEEAAAQALPILQDLGAAWEDGRRE